ncbi:hypothetical protein [Streptomyces sp. AC512_CC834]|uniref:hypothetical protein n=1 Tax=Streptomyces sp. AC512_CC834 TaxID=2823691 RepID=UPI001C267D95|nr:hypothetical protein [Streptomyces sp. AC512_CC834]
MDAMTASAILVEQLTAHGPSVAKQDDGTLSVTNPQYARVGENVTVGGSCYLTNYGYEIGQHGDEPATTDRVAFLLGLPVRQAVAR